ncbi:unnamed protein product [Penicillium camemberti]|uniref:Str. FM013 n=1 Tax=Penicillium camemberti (strain FM 013) TaxID=1429867 RepID=A0A0G4PE50_PENC3|nr:unnamed protein product [Penicillium camemberti]
MSAPSILVDSLPENLTLTSNTKQSEMSDESDSSDGECFKALPDDTIEAIGSTASAIRKVIRENEETTDVVKYISFINVPPAIAEKLYLRNTRQMFNHSTRCMIVKLVTRPHDLASRHLNVEVMYVLKEMGVHQSISMTGTHSVRGRYCEKQADESWLPIQPIPGRSTKWPTVTVEVDVSESYPKLKADAEWWLMNSRGDVKLVIIVSVNRKTPKIKFETVTLTPATLRLQRPRNVPTIRQSITTSRDPERPDATITVSPPVPLTIQFEELFCRQPVPPEHNIDLSPDQLREISRQVWAHQVF